MAQALSDGKKAPAHKTSSKQAKTPATPDPEAAAESKRKPGRPKKAVNDEANSAPEKRKPGRPKKTETTQPSSPAKRKPGRPKKSETEVPAKRKPGRPKKEA